MVEGFRYSRENRGKETVSETHATSLKCIDSESNCEERSDKLFSIYTYEETNILVTLMLIAALVAG